MAAKATPAGARKAVATQQAATINRPIFQLGAGSVAPIKVVEVNDEAMDNMATTLKQAVTGPLLEPMVVRAPRAIANIMQESSLAEAISNFKAEFANNSIYGTVGRASVKCNACMSCIRLWAPSSLGVQTGLGRGRAGHCLRSICQDIG